MPRLNDREVKGVIRRQEGVRGHLPRTDAREVEGVMRRKEGVRGHLTRTDAREVEGVMRRKEFDTDGCPGGRGSYEKERGS